MLLDRNSVQQTRLRLAEAAPGCEQLDNDTRLMRLLIVEDNKTLADWLAKLLRGSNYVVDCVHDGETAAHGTDLKTYDLLIVDLALPKMSGIDVVRHVRAAGLSTPILILTAKDALQSRVEGLDAGADDYLTKPFEVEELDARLRALLRRSNTTLKSELRFGSLSFDQNTRLFAIGGTSLHLSPREHALLETLLGEPVQRSARRCCSKAATASATTSTSAQSRFISTGCARSSRTPASRSQRCAGWDTC